MGAFLQKGEKTMNTRKIRWRQEGKETFSIAIAGDFCPREENCADLTARAYEITASVKPFFDSADMKVLQWECAVTKQDTPIDKSGPNHRCYPECAVFAEALGIDTVLLANNHTGDYGKPGVEDTLQTFAARGIRTVGAGMNEEEAAKPLYAECNGLKTAIINAAEYEFGMARGNSPGSNPLDPVVIAEKIKEEKEKNFLVIVTLHGGHEHFPFPSPRMRSWFRFFADCGADIVFNCHTHCPLGYEIYKGVPIVYCPGNFYFPPRPTSLPNWSIGYVPKFFIDKEGAYALELLPYFNTKAELLPMKEVEGKGFFEYLDRLCAPLDDKEELQRLFNAWCAHYRFSFGLFDKKSPGDLNDRNEVRAALGMRNLFTCQSHNDLHRNMLLLLEQYKLVSAGEDFSLIEELQKPSFKGMEKICK